MSKITATLAKTTSNKIAKSATSVLDTFLESLAEVLSRDLKPGQLAAVYHLINKKALKVLDDHKKVAHARLMELTLEHGKVPPDGKHRTVNVDDFKVEVRESHKSKPDDGAVEVLLRSKNIPATAGMDEIVSYEVNMRKLDELVRMQRLTKDEIADCYPPPGRALWVTKEKGE